MLRSCDFTDWSGEVSLGGLGWWRWEATRAVAASGRASCSFPCPSKTSTQHCKPRSPSSWCPHLLMSNIACQEQTTHKPFPCVAYSLDQGLTNCGASRAVGAASRLSTLSTWPVGKGARLFERAVLRSCLSFLLVGAGGDSVSGELLLGKTLECRLQPCHHPSMETMMVTRSMPRKTIRLLRYFRTSCIVPPHASFARPLTAQHTLK